jgi:ornithine carbamoyltransferase
LYPALAGASVLSLMEHSPAAVAAVLNSADMLSRTPRRAWPKLLSGRMIALIFERPSTRTRVSFEVGITHLGGHALVLAGRDMQMGRGETLEDTAKVLSRMVDAIVLRTGAHETLEELDLHSTVPVINSLSYAHHPCQALADALTLKQRFGALSGLRVAYVGDGNNCCVSLMVVGALTGMEIVAACPAGYEPDPEIVAWCRRMGQTTGGGAWVVDDAYAAVTDAQGIYTDTWISMGDEDQADRRRRDLSPYRVDADLLAAAAPDAIVLHCLPAHHGEEITYEVLHGPRSAVWTQAENRIHAQAALLGHILA